MAIVLIEYLLGGGRGATYDEPGISSGGRGPGGLAYGSEEAYSPVGDESGVSSGGHFGGFGGATISSTGEGSAPVGDEQGVATGNRVNINSLRRGGGGATSFYEDNSGGQQPGQGNSGS